MSVEQADIVQGSAWAETEILKSEIAKREVLVWNYKERKMRKYDYPRLYLTMADEDSHGLQPYTKEISDESDRYLSSIVNPGVISAAMSLDSRYHDEFVAEKIDRLNVLISGVRGLHWDAEKNTSKQGFDALAIKLDARMRTNWRSTVLSVGSYLSGREEGSAPMYLSMQRENWRYDDVPVAPVIGIAVGSVAPQKMVSPTEDHEGWYTIEKCPVIPVVLGKDDKPYLPPYANNLYTDRTAFEGHGASTKSKQLRKTNPREFRDAVYAARRRQWENRQKPLP